ADDDAATQGRVALALVPGGAAQGHAVVQRAVVAELGGLADHHAHAVVDESAPADLRPRMDLDAGEEARAGRSKPRQPAQFHAPEGVRQAVDEQRVEARVAGDDLPGRAGGGVAVEHARDVFSDPGEHRRIIGNLSELVNYSSRGRSQAASIPRRMFSSTLSSCARAKSRRSRSMSLRG